ncbi:hypothetical protein FGB62_98g072 [Gracilaria domingensis]|nr:hypothetical protein FGB62_98g072 [Gracilaria domingensis]
MSAVAKTMTLTKALVELKLLTKRIEKKIDTIKFIAVKKGDVLPAFIKSQAEFEKDQRASWQSLNDLMSRRRKIKTALVVKNATTTVEVAGEAMTIAKAIEKKNLVSTEKKILKQMRAALADGEREVDRHNHLVNERIAKLLETSYGNREKQLSKEDFERIVRPFKKGSMATLIDPLNCSKLAETLEEKLEKFFSEVDVCLSIANATTNITVL